MRILFRLFLIHIGLFYFYAANAESCNFTTKLTYKDGTTGCLESLPYANEIPEGQKEKLIKLVAFSDLYSVAKSKFKDCKALAFISGPMRVVGNIQNFTRLKEFDRMKLTNLDSCMNQGCDCEIVIENGNVMVDKEILLTGRSAAILSNEVNLVKLNKSNILMDSDNKQERLLAEAKIQEEQKVTQVKIKEQDRLLAEAKLVEEKRITQARLKEQERLLTEARLQEEQRVNQAKLKEQERLLLEAKLQDQKISQAKLKEQERLLAEAKQLEEQRISLARLKEQERLSAEAKLQEENKVAQAKLKEQEQLLAEVKIKEEQRIADLRKVIEKEVREKILNEMKIASTAIPIEQPPPVIYANRKALIIGNNSYQKIAKLQTAIEDANLMSEVLASLGFQVNLSLDVTEKKLKADLRNFKNLVKSGDEVVIFYAGHGVQIDSTNYLLPIDVSGQNEEEVKDEAIALQRLLDDMTEKKAKLTLAVIDACRDNPFKTTTRSAGTRGLAPTSPATGQMIVFSAGNNQLALDSLGPNDKVKNGVFTRIFSKEVQQAGISIDRVVRIVRSQVVDLARSIGHNQVPAIYDQVVGEFYFKK